MSSSTFDECLKDNMNQLRSYFKHGLPDYGISPFDPFYITEIPQKMSNPFFNYRLILKNVTESGWTASQVTKIRTDFNKDQMLVTQFFPDKRLNGSYEIEGSFFGQKVRNQGIWDLALFDYIQTLTISRKKAGPSAPLKNPPIKVKCNIQSCKKLELHIGNLAGGRTIVENMLDWIINRAWQPGFVVLSPIINDLVSTAFTEIMNRDFQNFPFDEVFKN
ncbi:juvenile hormone binding protein 16 isoform X2 [Leptinotarsa decemlineata]